MKCPFKFARYISEKDEVCVLDCAWRLYDTNGSSACAIAAQAANVVDGLLLNYEKLEFDEGEDEEE